MFGKNYFKPRTDFGRYIDKYEIPQQWLVEKTGISRNTIGTICNDPDYNPQANTKIKLISVLRKCGYDVSIDDFW